MTGGILQLAATGKEDEIISCNPSITLFKSIYRRHTNFDKVEQTLTFNNDLSFGMTSSCKIKKNADLVSALTLMIELPEIDISYIPLTNSALCEMLKEYGIQWEYESQNGKSLITQSEFETVVGKIEYDSGKMIRTTDGMINDKVDELTKTIMKDNKFIDTIITVSERYIYSHNENVNEFIDELMLELFKVNKDLFINDVEYINSSDYYNQYAYLYGYKNDLAQLAHQKISWQDGTLPMRKIISFYDPSNGLPIPRVEDRYISSVTDRGWVINGIYRYYDASSTGNNNWFPVVPTIGYGAHIEFGYDDMTKTLLKTCVGFDKTVLGFYEASIDGFPENPSIGDTYVSVGDYSSGYIWRNNFVYEWNGSTWNEKIPSYGNALFVTGVGNTLQQFKNRLVYFDGNNWTQHVHNMIVMYDGTQWRKSVINFYDPTNGLPTVSIPKSIGDTYISSETAKGWIKNNMYVWDGWEWSEIVPTEDYGVYIENGITYGDRIVIFDGAKWNVLAMPLPLYNFTRFRKFVSDTLQNIIFTDPNVELLYAVENCNTTVIPTTITQPIRQFFDKIVSAEIGTIDEHSAVYISVYDNYFDESNVG